MDIAVNVFVGEDEGRPRVMVEMPDGKYVAIWVDAKGRTKSVEMRVRPSGDWEPIHSM